jgi:hypothetical protein
MLGRVLALVESSSSKDHLWQVAGDLIQGFPERLGELERVLDRTSYALVVMGDDFLRGRIPMDDRYLVDEATKSHPYSAPRSKDTAASRVAGRYLIAQGKCPTCGSALSYDDGRDAYRCGMCGWVGGNGPVKTARHPIGEGAAPSAEHYFFDNPKKRETREFAQSGALSNFPATAAKSVKEMDNSTLSVSQARSDARDAPPTPTDIRKDPGGKQFSTLNRHLIVTEQPKVKGVPTDRDDLPMVKKPKGNL